MSTTGRAMAEYLGYTVEHRGSDWAALDNGDPVGNAPTEEEAWLKAIRSASSDVMGPHNLSSEDWDSMSGDEQLSLAMETYSPAARP